MTEPSASDVHASSAIGNDRPKKRGWKPFSAFIGEVKPASGSSTGVVKRYASVSELPKTVRDKLKGKPKKQRQWMHVWNSSYGSHGDESRAFASAWAAVEKIDALSLPPLVGLKNRILAPFDSGTYHVPFPAQPASLGTLRPDQVPRFLDAITHSKRLPLTVTDLKSLVAIKDRVTEEATQKHLKRLRDGKKIKPPVVVRLNGSDHIADGHDRLAAAWLNGDDRATVRYADVEPFSEAKPDPTVEHSGSRYDLLQPKNGRRLHWNDNGTLASPFVYDPQFLAGLRPDQVPKFTYALTHQKRFKPSRIALRDLVAIQDRINPDTVAAHVEAPSKKLPVIIRTNGASYIGDGHDRLAARWLSGDDDAEVRIADLGELPTNLAKSDWSVAFEIKKADPDQRMIFGWASVVTKDGKPIIDKQNDIIPVDELEKAFYDYVLYSRDQGHMHSRTGVGRMIECMVFTKQKQDALGIDLGIEGAWVGYLVDDDAVWAAHKRGELPEFSIGGAAVPVEVEV